MIITHQHQLKQTIRHIVKKISRRSKAWWIARQVRERLILKIGALAIILASLFSLAEGMWLFYSRLPQTRVQWLQREWLLEDIQWLMKSKPLAQVSSTVSNNNSVFLAQVNQPGVNGKCISQSAGQWLCTGDSASLEAVQQWWLKGRNEGYFVEKFEAKNHSPGLVTWTMVLHR